MARILKGNVITPLNTLGLEIDISEMNPVAHTTIFGNDDAKPSGMLKAMIQHDLDTGNKVIGVVFNSSYSGFAANPKTTVIDLTRANASFVINPQHANVLAALIVASPNSFMIDVGGLESGDAAKIIERIAATLSVQRQQVKRTTFAIDLTDVATPKRRMGLDADAVQQVNSVLGRGFEIGVRLVMVANSPSEFPLEFDRGTLQCLVTRVTRSSIAKVAEHVGDKGRIVANANLQDIGMASIPQGDFWFFPMTNDAYGPYLIKKVILDAAIGDDHQNHRPATGITKSFCEEYADAVEAAEEAALKAEARKKIDDLNRKQRVKQYMEADASYTPMRGGRARTMPLPPVKMGATIAQNPTPKQIADMLQQTDVKRPACRARVIAADAEIQGKAMTLDEAVAAGSTDEALRAACFGETLYTAGIVSKRVGAALGYRFIEESAGKVEAFRVRLLKRDPADIVGSVGEWLRKSSIHKMPLDGDGRIKAVTKAWRDHLAGRVLPKADNDVALPNAA